MCGRYRLSRRKQILEEHFDSVSGMEDWNPRYNIAPTQLVPIIRQNPKEPVRELSLFRLGTRSKVGERSVCRGKNDQCKIGDRKHETCLLRCVEISQVPDPCGRLLRMAEDRES
jgi:putative SOS response-associated peptidase YedK